MPYQPDQLIIADTPEQLYDDAAKNIVDYASQCVKQRGICHIALAGGSTPAKLHRTLSSQPLLEQMPWSACHFYFGDERMVAHEHADSNYGMAKRTLFDLAPIPAENIHPIPTHCQDASSCAAVYDNELRQVTPLDLVLLGIGQDGHTASLFPETTILKEREKFAAAVYVDKLRAWRISMTYPYINQARRVIILIQGSDKNAIVKQLLTQENNDAYPVTAVRPSGKLIWHLDKAAYEDDQSTVK